MHIKTRKKIAQKLLNELMSWITISRDLTPHEIETMQENWIESIELCLEGEALEKLRDEALERSKP